VCGLKHQKEKRSMTYFAGLDVSVKETRVCIVDDAGKIVREASSSRTSWKKASCAQRQNRRPEASSSLLFTRR
jgi:ribulose kinase